MAQSKCSGAFIASDGSEAGHTIFYAVQTQLSTNSTSYQVSIGFVIAMGSE
jgi:hypothetical protein